MMIGCKSFIISALSLGVPTGIPVGPNSQCPALLTHTRTQPPRGSLAPMQAKRTRSHLENFFDF